MQAQKTILRLRASNEELKQALRRNHFPVPMGSEGSCSLGCTHRAPEPPPSSSQVSFQSGESKGNEFQSSISVSTGEPSDATALDASQFIAECSDESMVTTTIAESDDGTTLHLQTPQGQPSNIIVPMATTNEQPEGPSISSGPDQLKDKSLASGIEVPQVMTPKAESMAQVLNQLDVLKRRRGMIKVNS